MGKDNMEEHTMDMPGTEPGILMNGINGILMVGKQLV